MGMNNELILQPMLGMMVLTAVVWFVLYARRIPAMKKAGVPVQTYTTPDKSAELLPDAVNYPAVVLPLVPVPVRERQRGHPAACRGLGICRVSRAAQPDSLHEEHRDMALLLLRGGGDGLVVHVGQGGARRPDLEGAVAGLTRTDAPDLLEIGHEYLAVADLAGLCRVHDCLDHALDQVV